MEVKLVDASALDIDRHILLLREAFGQSAWAAQIGTTLTRQFYIWKYFSPIGEAIISSGLIEGKLASSVAALPTLFQTPVGIRRGWQIGDIVTAPWARKRGLYRRCLRALVEALGEDILVCFPNDNSRKEIEHQGFRFATDVRTFVRPLNPFAARSRAARPEGGYAKFDGSDSLSRSGNYAFFKNRDYLEWRYQKNPACRYESLSSNEGYCVFRSFNLFGSAVSIVMDTAASNEKAVCGLIRNSERISAANGRFANFIMISSPLPPGMRKRYVQLPRLLLPKRQALYVRVPGLSVPPPSWDVQIGDWDGL
jgi:hypothetical protein